MGHAMTPIPVFSKEKEKSPPKVEQVCQYPGCKHIAEATWQLEVSNEKGSSVEMPFCWYHYYIVMGRHFTVFKDFESEAVWPFEIQGPLSEVEIAEQVIAAREAAILFKEKQEKAKELNNPTAKE